ncbi:MAG: LysR family transcriptional regulator [Gammaproteobacteria bacterium]|nr:LysR family transcriptional regulator [Gammaproteobacteria bacterium]MBU1601036.1 LysR family transcriptional regulator [Gammaproteobacteria bacterium]MBU2434395.1 LysR family transcriptional regulator [Gammaproteobacteria bacterium]MBU2450799.1 LysR family transcriptional regulator [Gammaproteobacteria bacterium]
MKITLRQLEVFVAIAHLENVSRAATQLNMSQSAASTALLELERHFDCPLFDRLGKSLRLNGNGRGLLPQAEDMLARAGEIEGYLAGGKLAPVAVGATLTIGNYLATLVVVEYLQKNPGSRVALSVCNTRQVIERLHRYELDIGLIEGEASDADLIFEPWIDDELVVFCAPSHPLAAAGSLRSTALAGQKWIVREPGSGTRALFDRAMRSVGVDADVCLELEHTEAIKRAVESGLGVGCLSRLSLREAFRRGSLVEIGTPDLALRRRFQFVRQRQRQVSTATQTFIAECRRLTGEASDTSQLTLPFIA